jgi:hypothetical protein
VFTSKRHDTAISLPITLTPPAGVTWNLQSAGTVVRVITRLPGAPNHKVRSPAVVTGTWTLRYDPAPEDVDTIGAFDVEVEVTLSNSKKVTFPTEGYLSWVIGSDLDNQ